MSLVKYDFPVSLQNAYTQDQQRIPNAQAVVRHDQDDKPIAIVSDKFQLYTHKEVLGAVSGFESAFGGDVEVNHKINDSGTRFMTTYTYLKVTEEVQVGDHVGFRVHVRNAYDGSISAKITAGGLVLICDNGMTTSKGGYDMRVRHDKKDVDWSSAFPEPEEVLSHFKREAKLWRDLAKMDLTDDDFVKYLEVAVDKGLVPRRVADAVDTEPRRTAWGLYNLCTFDITHKSQASDFSKVERLASLSRWMKKTFKGATDDSSDTSSPTETPAPTETGVH